MLKQLHKPKRSCLQSDGREQAAKDLQSCVHEEDGIVKATRAVQSHLGDKAPRCTQRTGRPENARTPSTAQDDVGERHTQLKD